ncbi:hypothetical protein C0Q70_19993 [Pomacea canaliculata]|uniref:Mab-21-like HhH/H2TH-like domain-containing protein n=1 Tax=Pomacea canaliculata TaxID=400727 RepID=A0A2T7NEA3_POMCA|nr:hypothetical protein C0Q70_19993 [Pomacea canaliculata]
MVDAWFDGFIPSSFINISVKLSVRSCSSNPDARETSMDEEPPDDSYVGDSFSAVLESAFPWLLNWNNNRETDTAMSVDKEELDGCENVLNVSYMASFFSIVLCSMCIAVFLTFTLLLLFMKKRKQYCGEKIVKLAENNSKDNEKTFNATNNDAVPRQQEIGKTDNSELKVQNIDTVQSVNEYTQQSRLIPILLPFYSSSRKLSPMQVVSRPNVVELFSCTVNHFLMELDHILGMTAAFSESSETSPESLPPPRTQHKGSMKRPKWRMPTSRPLLAVGTVSTKAEIQMWQKVVDMELKMRWNKTAPELDVSAVQDRRLSTVLQFYQQACPVKPEQWSAATLIINYVLTLLQNELVFGCVEEDQPIKIVDFCSFGSAANGTCIGKANRFNMASLKGSSTQATSNRVRPSIMRDRSQGISADLQWQLSNTNVVSSFMSFADRKLKACSIEGCHVMCQQILRALFSHSGKDTLLRSGEVHPHVLDSVVCFLLLESHPGAWELSCLPDRLSDCILFLKAALRNEWMPDFVLHNLHLQKQMPALKLLPLLTSKRQENLLASLQSEDIESMLAFIDARLQETGLKQCMKDDYSEEMWEYEFFIFG